MTGVRLGVDTHQAAACQLPDVLILELLRAQIAERRLEPAPVADLLDEVGKVFGDELPRDLTFELDAVTAVFAVVLTSKLRQGGSILQANLASGAHSRHTRSLSPFRCQFVCHTMNRLAGIQNRLSGKRRFSE